MDLPEAIGSLVQLLRRREAERSINLVNCMFFLKLAGIMKGVVADHKLLRPDD